MRRGPASGAWPLLALLVFLGMSGTARAAGVPGDVELQQAVVEGRARSQDAFRRALEQETLDAREISRVREQEESARRFSKAREAAERSRDGQIVGEEPGEELPTDFQIPWTLILLGVVTVLAVYVMRPRVRS